MIEPDPNLPSFLCCNVPSHNDCELSTFCINQSCPHRGLICYLCPFVKPHSEHSQLDIIPLKLIARGKNAAAKHKVMLELENELRKKQEQHLRQVQRVRKEIIETLDQYEQKIQQDFNVLKTEIFSDQHDLLEKFDKKDFKDKQDLQVHSEILLGKIEKEESKNNTAPPRWVYEEDAINFTQLTADTRAYLMGLQLQFKRVKENLTSLVSGFLQSPLLDLNIEEYLTQVLFKKAIREPEDPRNPNFLFGKASILSDMHSTTKTILSTNSSVVGKSPVRSEGQLDSTRKQKARFTFGRKQDLENNGVEVDNIIRENQKLARKTQTSPRENRSKSRYKSPPPIASVSKIKKDEKAGKIRHNTKHEENITAPKKTAIKQKNPVPVPAQKQELDSANESDENDLESGLNMVETDIRFSQVKSNNTMRIFKTPEERFDAVTFYPKLKDVQLEGFGFYCPLPCDGTRINLEYILYEGAQKDSQVLLHDEFRFDCDPVSVKESLEIERVLLKDPIVLKKKKWYTLVLLYANDVKVAFEVGKSKDVLPFVFLGIEKKLVKEWLGIKTNEGEKMYTLQFPFLIYSDITK